MSASRVWKAIQAGQLALGIKGAVAGAGQDALLRAVADVAGGPAVGGHVAEHHGVGGQALGIVAQEHAADDGRSLLTGQSTGGVKGTAVGALKDTEGGHHANRFGVGDFIGIGEITARSAGADNHHANDHRPLHRDRSEEILRYSGILSWVLRSEVSVVDIW